MGTRKTLRTAVVLMVALAVVLLSTSVALAADTGWTSPTANTGDWTNPEYAYDDDGYWHGYELAAVGQNGNIHQYHGYGFSIPAGARIDGIEVRLDAWCTSCPGAGSGSIDVELSWDGGSSWTNTGYGTGSLGTSSEATYILGGPDDYWGHAWTSSEINDHFRVRVTAHHTGLCLFNRVYLDWIPVAVYYTPLVDLHLEKEVDKESPNVNDEVMFTITVTNDGPSDATGVKVKDIAWPSKLTYVSDDSGGDYDPGTYIWNVGNLAVGASATLNITATVNDWGDWENIAEVWECDQDDIDSTPANYYPDYTIEDDTGAVTGSASPTAVTLSSFAAKSSAGSLAPPLWPGLAGLTVLAAGSVLWAKRRAG